MTPADTTEPAAPSPEEPPSIGGGSPPPIETLLTIDLSLQTEDADPPLAGWLEGMLLRAAALAGVRQGQLALAIVDDAQMAQLHEQWKGVPGTTDVLTFDLGDKEAPADQPEG